MLLGKFFGRDGLSALGILALKTRIVPLGLRIADSCPILSAVKAMRSQAWFAYRSASRLV